MLDAPSDLPSYMRNKAWVTGGYLTQIWYLSCCVSVRRAELTPKRWTPI